MIGFHVCRLAVAEFFGGDGCDDFLEESRVSSVFYGFFEVDLPL